MAQQLKKGQEVFRLYSWQIFKLNVFGLLTCFKMSVNRIMVIFNFILQPYIQYPHLLHVKYLIQSKQTTSLCSNKWDFVIRFFNRTSVSASCSVKLVHAYISNHGRKLFCTYGRIMKKPQFKDFTQSQFFMIATCRLRAVCQVNSTDTYCSFFILFCCDQQPFLYQMLYQANSILLKTFFF